MCRAYIEINRRPGSLARLDRKMSDASSEYLDRAVACEKLAVSVKTDVERELLLSRAKSLRALAGSEDWLSGKVAGALNAMSSVLPMPGAQSELAE
jgi:hypothetical protein